MERFEFIIDNENKPSGLYKVKKTINIGSKLSDFKIIKKLGEGHFSSVHLVTSKITHKNYAMKEIKTARYKTERQRLQVEKEIKLLENLDHPHVITYYNSFKEKDSFYIILEYIDNGSLYDLLRKNIKEGKKIEEKIIWDLLVQSLSGLFYLHENKKIIHRDIKPDNLLLDSKGCLKISDFGVSAIESENVDDLLKCHGTVAGPIQFMSPEMAFGDFYDFKSDIYMLGLTFFFLMTNKMAEKKITLGPIIIPIKNENVQLPESYSLDLRNFVNKLLKTPKLRPSAKDAYKEALNYYNKKYLQISSVCSILQCFNSIKKIKEYFKGEKLSNYILSNENSEEHNFITTKIFKEALSAINLPYFNNDKFMLNCLNLRLLLYNDKERMDQDSEADLNHFTRRLLHSLNDELNKSKKEERIPIDNKVDVTNEAEVINSVIDRFKKNFRSKISDQFYYISKITEECIVCNNVIKYLCSINILCILYPERTAKHFNKKNITLNDMFRHYNKTRLFSGVNEKCKYCNKEVNKINKIKIFYTTPFNYILYIDYSDEKTFNLKIDENIDIEDVVIRKDVSKVKYSLVGAIFKEIKENGELIYISITKSDNEWINYNGISIKKCTFNDLKNHKHVKMLFYSCIN